MKRSLQSELGHLAAILRFRGLSEGSVVSVGSVSFAEVVAAAVGSSDRSSAAT